MSDENRKNIIVLLSSPMKIDVVINILSAATLLFAVFSGILFFQLEKLVRINLGDMFKEPEYMWLGSILNQIKFLIPAVFFLISVLIFLLGSGIRKRLNGEMVALNDQIDAILSGNLEKRRMMRKEDVMEPVMAKLHHLCDKLKR